MRSVGTDRPIKEGPTTPGWAGDLGISEAKKPKSQPCGGLFVVVTARLHAHRVESQPQLSMLQFRINPVHKHKLVPAEQLSTASSSLRSVAAGVWYVLESGGGTVN